MVVVLPFRYDLWSSSEPVREEDLIDVHCLIPNGSYIVLRALSNTTLFELKEVIITEQTSDVTHALVKTTLHTSLTFFVLLSQTFFSVVTCSTIFKMKFFVYVHRTRAFRSCGRRLKSIRFLDICATSQCTLFTLLNHRPLESRRSVMNRSGYAMCSRFLRCSKSQKDKNCRRIAN